MYDNRIDPENPQPQFYGFSGEHGFSFDGFENFGIPYFLTSFTAADLLEVAEGHSLYFFIKNIRVNMLAQNSDFIYQLSVSLKCCSFDTSP